MNRVRKPLSEMTLEELWQLFPIILTPHRDEWGQWYAEERDRLSDILSEKRFIISHIGSTAIRGIWAKPIIDILVEIPHESSMASVGHSLAHAGYTCMSESERRVSYHLGYTEEGFADKVFHLHLRYAGDNAELYFRDYMNDNPQLACQYEALKLALWKKYEHHRDAYTHAKTEFISAHTEAAKKLYGERYENLLDPLMQ